MEIFTQYKRPKVRYHPGGGEALTPVEMGTYIPAKQQIERLMMSGVNLQMARMKDNYDLLANENDEDFKLSVSRDRGADMAEVYKELELLKGRFNEQYRKMQESRRAAAASGEGKGASNNKDDAGAEGKADDVVQ